MIVIPETQSQEKKDMLRLAGAELVEVPAVPYANPNNYVKVSGRLAEELASTVPGGAIWANQFDNVANRQAHIETTAPGDLRRDRRQRSTASSAPSAPAAPWPATGIGLKERNKAIKLGLADPMGAAMYSFFTSGELTFSGSSISEGIGQNRVTKNVEGAPVDMAWQIPDEEAVPIVYDLLLEEGPLRRPVDRHQHRRRHPHGQGTRARATPS